MHLALDVPPALAGSITWGPFVPLPDDRARWIQRELRRGASALELVSDGLDATTTGWPMRVVLVRADGAYRLHVFYAFFEHACALVVAGATREAVESALPIVRTAAPDWGGAVTALAQLWDIPVGASPPGADEPADISTDTALVQHLAGVTHARAGRTAEAIAAWEAAAALDPLYIDGLYNAGIAHFGQGDIVAALGCWERGLARAPRDFWFLRKLVQAHNALGKYADAGRARARLRDVWATSTDPSVQRATSYVFHQQDVDGVEIHASEVLAEIDGPPILFFEPAHHHGDRVRLHVEPLGEGGARLVLEQGQARTEVAAHARRPPFPDLVAQAHALLRAAL